MSKNSQARRAGATRRLAIMGGAALAVCAAPPLRPSAQAATETERVDPSAFPVLGTVDRNYQSYTVEMLEVIGGNFWKPYAARLSGVPKAGGGAVGAGDSPYEYIAPIDLANPRLRMLARALGPAYMRVSGTWANSVYFADSDTPPKDPPAGFKGVLTRAQWKGVVEFSKAVNAPIVTSFAVSPGVRDAGGAWTSDQAHRWMTYTKSIGGSIYAAEFMNEPSMAGIGGAPKGYDAMAYARDFKRFRTWAKREAPTLLVLGPGSATETPGPWGIPSTLPGSIATADMLAASDSKLDAFTYHHYGASSSRCAPMHMPQTSLGAALSEEWLGRTSATRAFYAELRDRYEPGKPMWMTEGADAACGGNPWGGSFIDSFRYLDQLGRLAREGVKVVFHNTLAASDYALLNPSDLTPKSNYWAALLWHKLMGARVLDAGIASREGLHVYAHCGPGGKGAVSLLVINNSVAAASNLQLPVSSLRYTLTAPGEGSNSAMLNARLLKLTGRGQLPPLDGRAQGRGIVQFAPTTITFLAVPGARNPRCV